RRGPRGTENALPHAPPAPARRRGRHRPNPTPTMRSRRESTEPGEGPPEDPGTRLGTPVSRAVHEVRDRLHVPEGAEEGPAQADPSLVLPDGGGEGQPRLRRRGRRYPRQHVPPGAGAL